MMGDARFDECHNKPGYFEVFEKAATKQPPRGTGDTIKQITDATGISKLAKLYTQITGNDCGCGQRQAKWNRWFRYREQITVAVTTAPREKPTLQTTIASLIANRWEPHIFSEPGVDLTSLSQLPIHNNAVRLGAWFNWFHSCKTVLDTTRSDYILTVQDDTVIAPGTAEFLASFEWPSDSCGMVSLYTPTQYTKRTPGLHRIRTNSLWGACAMLFRRSDLQRIIDTKVAKNWRGAAFKTRKRPREDWEVANVDTAIGKALRELGLHPYFFSPSLSQHIGDTSSIGHKGMGPRRIASDVVTDWSVFDD
jgi:hypothetical protein